MDMNRREFLVALTVAATASACACAADNSANSDQSLPDGSILDAGPLDSFTEEKVYDQFRDQGVLLIRRGEELFALSSICTHKGCKVRPQEDRSFQCKCHKSRFDPDGKVINKPATTDLLRLEVTISPEKHVLVTVRKPTLTGKPR